jgi:hypothetical protein
MPQWTPATPRQPFRDRTTRLWIALVAGLACLVVGLGVGVAIGHATGHDDRGPGRFGRFPGDGGGPGFGMRDGRRPDFRNGPGMPGQQQPSGPPSASPSAPPASPGAAG